MRRSRDRRPAVLLLALAMCGVAAGCSNPASTGTPPSAATPEPPGETRCGSVENGRNHGYELVITGRRNSCEEARRILTTYRLRDTEKSGSGAFAVVEDYTCGRGSTADSQETGEAERCVQQSGDSRIVVRRTE
jgi:hypothetical protein